ncbi:hypothetical protein KAU45_00315, partial [bacterium]|nr:hypothetical protein [bacterium]
MSKLRLYPAVGLVSMATLVYELSLMRVFSVTIWYYFAFLVISLALLGGGAAAAFVFIRRDWFKKHLDRLLPGAAILFGVFCAVSPVIYLAMEIKMAIWAYLVITLLLFFIPFLLGGFIIAAIFSFHSERIGTLYWTDLLGAGLGCLVVVPLLYLIPAPSLLAWAGLLPVAAGVILMDRKKASWRNFTIAAGAVVLALSLSSLTSLNPYRVRFSKVDHSQDELMYVQWNPIARLSVYEGVSRYRAERPISAGLGTAFPGAEIEQYWIEQDEFAGAPILHFDGDYHDIAFVEYDVSNLAYMYRDFGEVCIIGAGGGRDILAAKYFGTPSIDAVEINPGIVEITEEVYGDFSGRPYSLPGVTAVVEEGRSYLEGTDKDFDLIQISLIDSLVASMAGAFALAEHSLYTLEAFDLYLDRLGEDGVLSVSRFYYPINHFETYRLTNLCAETLRWRGIDSPGDHIVLMGADIMSTALVSKKPFTETELDRLGEIARRVGFFELWVPGRTSTDYYIHHMLTLENPEAFIEALPI